MADPGWILVITLPVGAPGPQDSVGASKHDTGIWYATVAVSVPSPSLWKEVGIENGSSAGLTPGFVRAGMLAGLPFSVAVHMPTILKV
jgi:hypothetical protein